jgi:Dolichyl-phosphate-mannose-protein mannosyltransferase
MEVSHNQAIEVAHAGQRASPYEQASPGQHAALQGPGAPVVVALLTVLGAALRLATVTQPLYGDELSTHWVVTEHGFFDVLSVVHANWEITPPLYFLLSWLTTVPDVTPALLRLPSLLAGIATVPLVYLLGTRTVGRPAALVGTALTALSPFLIFYSTEARSYQLLIVLVVLSTLALLAALDDQRARWWIAYGACSCAAMYTHYTGVFALLGQFLWVVWAYPHARKSALLANVGALVAYLPWVSGLRNDLSSPTTDILSALSPFTAETVRISLQHWSVGHPFAYESTGLRDLPGEIALAMLAAGIVVAVAGLLWSRLRGSARRGSAIPDRRVMLVLVLAVSVPVGEALASALGDDVFGTRNLAASWPAFGLSLGALLVASGPRLRLPAIALAVGAFAIGAVKMLDAPFERPAFDSAADFIEREATGGDVVIDAVVFSVSPGPLSPLDAELDRSSGVFRVGAPQQRERPFTVLDTTLPTDEAVRRAVDQADGGRVFLLTVGADTPLVLSLVREVVAGALPPRYRRVAARSYPGIISLDVVVYADGGRPGE